MSFPFRWTWCPIGERMRCRAWRNLGVASRSKGRLPRAPREGWSDANRRAGTGHHLPSAAEGRVNHEYPYASTEEGGSSADVSNQSRTESDIEGQTLKKVYNRQNVKVGNRFTTAYCGNDGQSRCIQCAATRQQQQNRQQNSSNAQRENAIRSANANNSGGQRGGEQQSGHRGSGDKPHRTQSKKPKKQSSSHKLRKGQK
jgi:hypothetical protein